MMPSPARILLAGVVAVPLLLAGCARTPEPPEPDPAALKAEGEKLKKEHERETRESGKPRKP